MRVCLTPGCNNDISHRHKLTQYCSSSCAVKMNRINNPKDLKGPYRVLRHCTECFDLFIAVGKRHEYCSDMCQARKCINCGKALHATVKGLITRTGKCKNCAGTPASWLGHLTITKPKDETYIHNGVNTHSATTPYFVNR